MSRATSKCVESNRTAATARVDTREGGREANFRSRAPAKANLRDFMAITKALADEQRVRVLLALQGGELCVCQIVALLGLATSTVSKHMSILKQARLVDSRKDGRWMYYRLAEENASEVVRQATALVAGSLAGDPQVLRDKQRLADICTSDPQALCAAQTRRFA